MGKVMVLSFSDEEEDIYQKMMQIISNSKKQGVQQRTNL